MSCYAVAVARCHARAFRLQMSNPATLETLGLFAAAIFRFVVGETTMYTSWECRVSRLRCGLPWRQTWFDNLLSSGVVCEHLA